MLKYRAKKNDNLWKEEWKEACEAIRAAKTPRRYSIEELRKLKSRILIACISYKGMINANIEDQEVSDYVYDKMELLESRIEGLFDEMEDYI